MRKLYIHRWLSRLSCAALIMGGIHFGFAGPIPAQEAVLPPAVTQPAEESLATPAAFDPPALYAVWTSDPTTTISILWQTRGDFPAEANQPMQLEYCLKEDKAEWQTVAATGAPMPFSNRTTLRADLKELRPGTEYFFRLDPKARVYLFRTMPATLERPLRFAAGGDTMHNRSFFEKTNREAMRHDLDFVLLGGDLAYENGNPKQVQRIYDWLDVAKQSFITPEGRVVPIVVAIGNHETRSGTYENIRDKAPYYYALFPFPGVPGYNVLDFGKYLSIIALDTGHTAPIEGAQTEWLEKTLKERQGVPHIFPIYHVPIYSSARNFKENSPQLKNWAPLFEKYGVRVAFENHDHAYKRTHPMREGKVVKDDEGVVYLGDGAWGTRPRAVPEKWYIAKGAEVRHFILATLEGERQQFQMFDEDGNQFDSYPVQYWTLVR